MRMIRMKAALMAMAGAASMAALGLASPAAAEVDFAGKKINFYTSHRGADSVLSLQTWSNYIAKYLPGKPEITVVSKFGGGGLTNANFYAGACKPDGLSATMFNNVVQMSWPMKLPGVQYDLSKFKTIGAEAQTFLHLAGTSSKLAAGDNPDIAGVGEQTYGTRTRNVNVMAAEILFNTAGNPLKVVTGFGETEAIIQALASGELNMSYVFTPAWVRNKDNYSSLGLKAIFQMGLLDDAGKTVRIKEVPEVPTAMELYLKMKPDGEGSAEYKALKTASGLGQIGKGYYLCPETPDDIVEAWRTAMDKAIADPEFVAEHRKLLNADIDYVPAKQAEMILNDLIGALEEPFFQKGGAGFNMVMGEQ